ncbi:alpha-hydroxyketone-type quorum-sensing autoinducer synthase [Oceanibacterium hippocampi]|uniref:CAI-1 autoinducer synthase n=1 Tax=Oceanibacterium hippocampi TaxID=745714 RepID=A0A1Y5S560_9PROT|nr:alpha-hydroxyketone-type quorum-sensing autoinducer synthase [Oceanibacterium hippocampi]SLN30041.1 CAI-1 autoinducer synthase [Oceanibacterium hippocampi]
MSVIRLSASRPSTAAASSPVLASLEKRIDGYFHNYPDGHVTCGRAPRAGDIELASNDYLVLAGDRRIVEAQSKALQASEAGPYMSGVFIQYLSTQRTLERRFATFFGYEDAVLCQSGFVANEGLMQAIAGPDIPVYLDMYVHASMEQGVRAAGAPLHRFRHNRPEHLRLMIGRHGPGVVAVDSLYSTGGDFCDLEGLIAVCEETGSILVVDESHAVATTGARGEGLVASRGLQDKVPFITFSLSKGFVGRAGLIAASSRFVEYFRYESRPAIFSSAILPWEVTRFAKTLDIIERAGPVRERLHANAAYLRAGLVAAGYDIGESVSQIIPLVAGTEANTARLAKALEDEGIIGSVFCAPATPKNRAMVRFCVNQALNQAALDRVIEACARVRENLFDPSWPCFRGTEDRVAPPSQVTAAAG